MKPLFLLGLGLAISLQAQVSSPPPAPSANSTAAPAQALRSEADLHTLLGPIALYPDALIGLILPASTTPADIVLAARTLGANSSSDALAAQPWDDSVKALTHYPDLLRWLDQNLTWTQALGEAFVSQPADVMNAVQRLRQQARAAGTLVDTPQQQVVTENNALVIVPAQPDVIYVPVYDPAVVYVSRTTFISHRHVYFHSAYRTGPWLCYRPDWRHGYLHVGHSHWYRSPHSIHHWPHAHHPGHVWSPRPSRPHIHHNHYSAPGANRPSSFVSTPGRSSPRPSSSYTPASTKPASPFYKPPGRPATRSSNDARIPANNLRAPRNDHREHLLPSRSDPAPSGFFQPDSIKPKSRKN